MNTGSTQKSRAFWTWIPGLAPMLLLVAILTLAAHVRLGLGHWPTPMVESYHSPGYLRHEVIVGLIGGFALYVAGPLWAIFVAIPWFRISAKTHLIQLAMYLGGFLLIFLAGKFDPTPFTEWLLD